MGYTVYEFKPQSFPEFTNEDRLGNSDWYVFKKKPLLRMYKYFPKNHFLSRAINLSLLSISISSEMKDLNFNVETNVFDTLIRKCATLWC